MMETSGVEDDENIGENIYKDVKNLLRLSKLKKKTVLQIKV